MKPNQRNPESGYALLLIFAMAAVIAITLYSQVPRVAFEAQRDQEQLLVDRGQEYSRAIALFVRKNNRFPGSMEELDDTNRQRFLRRHFVDPMTGKADWRLLHAGPGGVITDSVTNVKKPDGSSLPSGFITDLGSLVGGAVATHSDGVNLATRQRPSDQAGSSGDMYASPSNNASNPTPASSGPIPGYNGPVMVLPDGRIVPANASGNAPPPPGTLPVGATGQTALPGQQPPLPNGVAIQQQLQQVQQQLNAQQVAQNGGGPPLPPGVNGVSNGAAGLINQILTTPRPGGINGLPGQGGVSVGGPGGALTAGPAPNAAAPQQQVIGAGIAGVASKREQEGIKTINDRTKYNEWEFVYDVTKDPARAGQGRGGAAGGTGGQGTPNPQGQPATQSPFGVNPGAAPFSPGSGPGR